MDDLEDQIAALSRAGRSGRQIAEELGLDRRHVDAARQRLGFGRPPAAERRRIELALQARIRELVKAGHPDGQIAEQLGVSTNVVQRRRAALGLASAGRAGRPREGDDVRDRKVFATVSAREKAEIEAAAGNRPVSTWVREVLLEAARRGR